MQIALIAPSPVPFVWGGAENLYAGLQAYINAETRHACEIIKVPVVERDLPSLLASYRTCLDADVGHFDAIISTKYPSWMAQNTRHICYMLHKLRGLYDTYHFTREPLDLDGVDPATLALLDRFEDRLSSRKTSAGDVRDLIDTLSHTIAGSRDDPQFRFPGPLARKVVHLLDGFALSPDRISCHAAISRNVAGRQDYFPSTGQVSVLYPPPRTSGFRCGSDDYFFTMSRLDSPKRIDLLIQAVLAMRNPVPLLIAGTGPEEARLKALAGDNPSIRFLGSVTDEEALSLYADALAVPFLPYDEDYGYITIEAMASGKPVITTSDSGGPLEFVRHGETGLVCAPEVEALTAALDHAASHRRDMRSMGQTARSQVASVSWQSVTEGLLGGLEQPASPAPRLGVRRPDRHKIVVLVTFPIYPARGGGQTRILNLYGALAREMDVEVISLVGADDEAETREIMPGLVQTKVPANAAQIEAETALSANMGWVPVTDIAAINGWSLNPALLDALHTASRGARAIVLSHPYLHRCYKALESDIPMWFEAHNVEAPLKAQILPDTPEAKALVNLVSEVEGDCWREAEIVFACAQADIDALAVKFGPRTGPSLPVPNGVRPSDSPFVAPGERAALRAQLGLEQGASTLFVDSWHEPNIVAAREIVSTARDLPTIRFMIAGSVCLAIQNEERPSNVILLGVLDDEVKALVSNTCDLALNPMETGSGSNLKMFDYFSSGIAVVSTAFGARGIDFDGYDQCYFESELDKFGLTIVKALADMPARQAVATSARSLIDHRYDWDIIADRFHAALKASLNNF